MKITVNQALQKAIKAHKAGHAWEANRLYTAILKAQPENSDANHNMGMLAVGIGKIQEALPFFKIALEGNPNTTQFWLSYIEALTKLDRLADAKAILDKAKDNGAKGDDFDKLERKLSGIGNKSTEEPSANNARDPSVEQIQSLINLFDQGRSNETLDKASQLLQRFPRSFIIYNIIGVANKSLGQLDAAIKAYKMAILLKSDYADAYSNMGNSLKEQGKLEEAIEACMTAIAFKPKHADAYTNMGSIFQEQDKLEEAIEAFNKALALKPDYAEVHRILSTIKKYTSKDAQFYQMRRCYENKNLTDNAKCNLSFALAKAYDDLSEFDKAFAYLVEGNALRKKLLNYVIVEDQNLFFNLKKSQPIIMNHTLNIEKCTNKLVPIFILGMPRSGTSLVEQIISSHSMVTGAGELSYISQFGTDLAQGVSPPSLENISNFRRSYLSELAKEAHGKHFVTDKMPQNFLFIALICAALPEAKIIHVGRDPAATCWSNYMQYFETKSLGFCYDLEDVVAYYGLYSNLMKFWKFYYNNQIYSLNYEELTKKQDYETRQLIKYLDLDWQGACLEPQHNKRKVRTASQQQVRKKLYQGSSKVWRKYEPFLGTAFNSFYSVS
jgi:tetratricopeptide (TPR) repeat protein